jgi:hypothetical protein
MKTTIKFENLINDGLEKYLEVNGNKIENVGESLIELDEKSIMLNCYKDEQTLKYIPIFEYENQGQISQYNTFNAAFNDLIKSEEGDLSANQ